MVFFRKRKYHIDYQAHFCKQSTCFNMENEMKRKFYEQLDVKIENKKSNNSFLNREKYELLIHKICQLKRGDRKKEQQLSIGMRFLVHVLTLLDKVVQILLSDHGTQESI